MKKTTLQVLPGFYLTLAAGILLIPLPWLFAWIIAAAVHELFHLLAVMLFGHSVLSITVDGGGTVIASDMPQGLKMTVCAIMGPVGGLILLLFLRYIPRIAICGFIQSIYNLLPLCHLDGGRALYGILVSFMHPKTADHIAVMLERIIIFFLIIAGVYALIVLKLGIMPLVFIAVLLLKNKKSLAKKVA